MLRFLRLTILFVAADAQPDKSSRRTSEILLSGQVLVCKHVSSITLVDTNDVILGPDCDDVCAVAIRGYTQDARQVVFPWAKCAAKRSLVKIHPGFLPRSTRCFLHTPVQKGLAGVHYVATDPSGRRLFGL